MRLVSMITSLALAAPLAAQTTDTALASAIRRVYRAEAVPGMAIAVVRDSQVVLLEGFGWADREAGRRVTPETVFYIASATKSFTGLAAALLDRDGVMPLDAPLSRWLPVTLQPPLDADSITLRMLLTHTHGILNDGGLTFRLAYSGDWTEAQLLSLLAGQKPNPEGRVFNYGNIGYNVAAMAMDRATGRSWKEVLRDRVFEPAGMRATTAWMSRADPERLALPYAPVDTGFVRIPLTKTDANMHSAGGVVSTAADLARWLEVNVTGGMLDGRRILPAEVLRRAHHPWAEQDERFDAYQRVAYGLGWNHGVYDGDTLLHHFGGFPGHGAQVMFSPRHRIGIAVLTNGGRAFDFGDIVARYVLDRYRGRADADARLAARLDSFDLETRDFQRRYAENLAQRRARPQALPQPLAAYAGTYENPELGRIVWSVAGDRLAARFGVMENVAETYDAATHALRVELPPGAGRVARFTVENGRATGVTLAGMKFERVDD